MKKSIVTAAFLALLSPGLLAQTGEMNPEEAGMEKVRAGFKETWVKPGADFTKYDKLLFGEAEFQFRDVGPAKKYRTNTLATRHKREFGVLEEDKKKFEQVVGEAFQKEMQRSKKFTVVNDLQPGTLLIEGAILDIVSNVPPEIVGMSETYLAQIGTGTLVLEIYDAESGEALAYLEERRKITPPGGGRIDEFSRPANSVTITSDISRWARSLASRFRSELEKAQKGK